MVQAALSKHFSLFGALQFESDARGPGVRGDALGLSQTLVSFSSVDCESEVRAICSFFTSVSEQVQLSRLSRTSRRATEGTLFVSEARDAGFEAQVREAFRNVQLALV